jgi:hypothetical protein
VNYSEFRVDARSSILSGRPAHVVRDRHVTFLWRDLALLEQRFADAGFAITRSRSGQRVLFCRDPDGNGVELIEASLSGPGQRKEGNN